MPPSSTLADTERLDWLEKHLFSIRIWILHGTEGDGDSLRQLADRALRIEELNGYVLENMHPAKNPNMQPTDSEGHVR